MKRILNIGCGDELYGTHRVDIVKTKSSNQEPFDANGQFPYPNNYFDEIFSRNLLEHLQNIKTFLSECHRVLKPNGKITLITDNAGYWLFHNMKAKIKLHYGEYIPMVGAVNDSHFELFTPYHVWNYLRGNGFEKIKIRFINFEDIYNGQPEIKLFQFWKPKNIISDLITWTIRHTQFYPMSWPKIIATANKSSKTRRIIWQK